MHKRLASKPKRKPLIACSGPFSHEDGERIQMKKFTQDRCLFQIAHRCSQMSAM